MKPLDRVRWIPLNPNVDARGSLTAVESLRTIPFAIQRVYFMHDLTSARGEHAHRDTQQLLIALAGSCDVVLADGTDERVYHCDDPAKGLHIHPMIFIRVCNISPDAIILVLASTHYDKSRTIRSWQEYLEAVQ